MENIAKTTATIEELQTKQVELEQHNARLKHQVEELTHKLQWFEEQYRLNQHRRFGNSSEQTDSTQINLFNEAEAESKPDAPESDLVEEITYKRRKKVGQREAKLDGLPVDVVEHRLPEEEQVCSCCGGNLHEMSTETRNEIEVIPPQVKVVRHVRYVYACRHCEQNEVDVKHIKTAPAPRPALPGSPASASAIAYVMSEKYVNGMPLYRQEAHWNRLGFELSRQTMANWIRAGIGSMASPPVRPAALSPLAERYY